MHRRLTMNCNAKDHAGKGETVMALWHLIHDVRKHCQEVIERNEQWAKDNDCDIEMSDSIKGWDDMARDILAIIKNNRKG